VRHSHRVLPLSIIGPAKVIGALAAEPVRTAPGAGTVMVGE
jgi:hypothetical protein